MATTYAFFHDSALTQEISSGNPLAFSSLAPADAQVFLGSTTAAISAQATSNPGVDDVEVFPFDTGTGQAVTDVLLSTSQIGLDSATPGATLACGASIPSGSGNGFPVWVRYTPSVLTPGAYTNIVLRTNDITDVPD